LNFSNVFRVGVSFGGFVAELIGMMVALDFDVMLIAPLSFRSGQARFDLDQLVVVRPQAVAMKRPALTAGRFAI
jgi:hypothetical protein